MRVPPRLIDLHVLTFLRGICLSTREFPCFVLEVKCQSNFTTKTFYWSTELENELNLHYFLVKAKLVCALKARGIIV